MGKQHKKMDLKKEEWCEEYVSNGQRANDATLMVYEPSSIKQAKEKTRMILQDQQVTAFMRGFLFANKATQLAGGVIVNGLKAEKVIRDRDGVEIGREPDHNTRFKFLEPVDKILNIYPKEEDVKSEDDLVMERAEAYAKLNLTDDEADYMIHHNAQKPTPEELEEWIDREITVDIIEE